MEDILMKINTYNGPIAMIDILGYKEKLCMNSIDHIKNIINELIRIIDTVSTIVNRDRCRFNYFSNNNTTHTTVIDYVFFADTFLLFLESDNSCKINEPANSINSLCYATLLIMGESFKNNISLRGAISFGEFYIQKDPVIIIGKPLSEIAQLEKSQNWAGVVLSYDLDSFNLEDSFIVTYPVPFKKNTKEMRVINWPLFSYDPDFDRCFDSNRPDVVTKRENTKEFYENNCQNTPPPFSCH